ncbi:MAG: hypothetical protein QXM73_01715 [Candidatus Nezhaarchaeales archaeon]
MLTPYTVAVLVSSATCLILFCYIVYKLLKVHVKLQAKSLLYLSSSFMLLAISQVFSILSVIVESARLSLTFYTATSSFAAIAFLLMVISVIQEERIALAFPTLILVPDFLACILAATASTLCRSRQLKAYLLALSMIHLARCFSATLMSLDLGALMLASAELVRAFATLLFAAFHVSRVVSRE